MRELHWVFLGRDAVKVGDLVSTDAGGMPIYRVMEIEGGQALLQDEEATGLRRMPLDRFRWRAADPDAPPGPARAA
jgi:hypothetical protein